MTGIIDRGITTAKFPFIAPLDTCLVTNENIALKVYRAQLEKLSIRPQDKMKVIKTEKTLQDLGFVAYVSYLNDDKRNLIMESNVKHFIPRRPVWKRFVKHTSSNNVRCVAKR